MSLSDIIDEYDKHGRLSRRSVERLRQELLGSDPYDAITIATDCAAFDLAPEIAHSLDSPDPMVRWNALGALFTRFRLPDHADKALRMASSDKSDVVKGIALCGLGEILPKIRDTALRRKAASLLISVLEDPNPIDEMRAAAYDGILAALDVLPFDRPPANKALKPESIDLRKVQTFKVQYC